MVFTDVDEICIDFISAMPKIGLGDGKRSYQLAGVGRQEAKP